MKSIGTLTLFFILSCAPSLYKAKQIDVIGNYTHIYTGTMFPERYHDYVRTDVTAFDNKQSNIGVTYALHGDVDQLEFTLYIYPAGGADEDRLCSQYSESLAAIAIASGKEIDVKQQPFFYSKNGYRFVGLNAAMHLGKYASSLTVFECGKWFQKFRITSKTYDLKIIDSVQTSILNDFSPADIVAKYPLDIGADIRVAPAAFQDSVLLKSVLAGAFKKLSWTRENVDSLERCAGFPGLYLAAHTEPLREMIKCWKSQTGKRLKSTDAYFRELEFIDNSGFLNEFVMDQYNMILISSDSVKMNFKAYDIWKKKNKPNIDLHKKYYLIGYEFPK